MIIRSAEILSFRRVPVGRMVFALTEVEQRAQKRGLQTIAEHASMGASYGREVLKDAMRWAASSRGRYVPEAADLDFEIDGVLAGIDGYLQSQERIYPNDARGDAATTLRQQLLPEGVAAIIRLPFAQQHAQITALLERANDPDMAEVHAALPEFAELLARLSELNQRYGEALQQETEVPTRGELAAGRARGQDILADTAALILAHYALQAPDDDDGRTDLLQPILEQVAAARRRRGAPDIDPDTGEPNTGEPSPGTPVLSEPDISPPEGDDPGLTPNVN